MPSLLLSTSTGNTGMSLAKTTVDKLLKGYDIRLRPDFGGMFTSSISNPVTVVVAQNKCLYVDIWALRCDVYESLLRNGSRGFASGRERTGHM